MKGEGGRGAGGGLGGCWRAQFLRLGRGKRHRRWRMPHHRATYCIYIQSQTPCLCCLVDPTHLVAPLLMMS